MLLLNVGFLEQDVQVITHFYCQAVKQLLSDDSSEPVKLIWNIFSERI